MTSFRSQIHPKEGCLAGGPVRWVLGLESSGKAGSVGLVSDAGHAFHEELPPDSSSLTHLVPAIDALLHQAKVLRTDLAAIAVTVGPGSFTGLRVGIATAKALAFALKIPVAPIDTLHALALQLVHSPELLPVSIQRLDVLLDAYRGQLFSASWQRYTSGDWAPQLPSHLLDVDAWLATLTQPNNSPMAVAGPGLERLHSKLSPEILQIPAGSSRLLGSTIARMGWISLQENATLPPNLVVPNYLRRSAAEEKAS